NYSRYVVDLNRSADDAVLYAGQVSTGLCPAQTFDGEAIYTDGKAVDEKERRRRVTLYWEPYHAQIAEGLARIRRRFGHACLWDAHSIRGSVPRLFDGILPDLNIGTNDGRSCAVAIQDRIAAVAAASPFTSVVNGRFKGGYITRHYGQPQEGIHAVQLELAQRCYMDEDTLRHDETRAAKLAGTIRELLESFLI
ncbi:MAG: N-formylglutamate deformylase, partial [Gammaproteobacteria bacterium PRO9]|nr:N-formylglutamate deformylase [Gammaproteobacteria bacterium PRO9]